MKSSTFINNKSYFKTTNKDYLVAAKQWLLKTPERALNQAYNAALTIKSIEEEYFNNNKISPNSSNHSDTVLSYFQADLEKHLSTAKLRLAEFKASRTILGISSSDHLDKLSFIDKVINKYTEVDNTSVVLPVSLQSSKEEKKVNTQPITSVIETIKVDSTSSSSRFLSRTLGKTINRFTTDLGSTTEAEVIKKLRSSRAKQTTAIKFILVLILIPVLTQQVSKNFVIYPIVNQVRGKNEAQVFLNSEMKEEAFRQLQSFEEDLKFASLIQNTPELSPEVKEEQVKLKAEAIAQDYYQKSNSAISNVFADLLALVAFTLIILISKKEIIILKSFMGDIVHGLSDTAKAFIIILFADVFVGFHSPHGWEVVIEGMASHLGIPANRNLIFLFIATFPVVLDAMFKFWVFRYMSMLSPSAAATYRNMSE